ncbi:hypothetical protein COV53_03450 [Candidatus Gottesmanbacteria bacterium CG11_big_fil_rev_8_21_14_0_20_37_11]|uniref:N-acetyltransferase domain-containing protein n=3 Tax=Candidatus Gottesmaniibacteriota TaxID=1752720 RepID=A0A2M7RPF4_9BACT|nr:MAG: hypothetical protein AUJ73_01760 [Candidatus Gottesmanbacteria bacterium CG1_02_37_22]PIP33039.1 MAG: hypothetical protein COX23_01500 [Candidatus Gottesmanbacteria bacterium CG23_combo_of_CG06-09_8_20_14_all_37_19]PIR08354.1 MAG: hypothetical protein COV53_03450 [Candidatus Gottesmanbacteria bacterium CG11_big_fil_rev_8_21_14_0_20_37_11]PIZ02207.1 MAG: hypothetical protein COY59_06060 [Candidatus Gottesmanbacteria bacterium CG_4_10_14_0_8_um_filter_37_24]
MVTKLTSQDLKAVSAIHQAELPGILSEFGTEFLEKFYRESLHIPELFTFIEKEDEQVIGLITGTTSLDGLYFKVVKRDILGFFSLIMKHLITHPASIFKIIRILTYPGFSNKDSELLTIAVSRRYQKRGIGRKLFASAVKEFKKRKIIHFKIGVYERLKANGFYRKIGCRKLHTFNFLGEQMNYYVYRQP